MKILLVMEKRVNAGSIQAAANYVRAGDELGHTIAVYGCPDVKCPTIRFSADVAAFDYVLFIVESKLEWMSGLRLPRIFAAAPWERRAVLDADGMYNRRITVEGYDRNHLTDKERDRWRVALQRLGRKILQPTFTPLAPDVIPLPFYGYDTGTVIPEETRPAKRFDIAHVGHNWWRWRQVDSQLLPAIERIRPEIGEICFVGLWWDAVPPWASKLGLDSAFCVDADRFRRLRIQVRPP